MRTRIMFLLMAILLLLVPASLGGAQTSPPDSCEQAKITNSELDNWLDYVTPNGTRQTNLRNDLRSFVGDVEAFTCPTTTTTTTEPSTTTTTQPPTSPEFPTPVNTGLLTPTTQTHEGDLTITTPGFVLEDTRVTGIVRVRANDVVINDSHIEGVENELGFCGWSFTIQDSQVGDPEDPNTPEWGIGCGNFTAYRNEVYAHDGFRSSGEHVLIQDNFFLAQPDLVSPDPHYDGFQGYFSGSDVVVRHNTLDQRPLSSGVNAQLFAADESVRVSAVNNLLLGDGFSLKLNDDIQEAGTEPLWVATGNRFVSTGFGPWASVGLTCGVDLIFNDNHLVTVDANYQIVNLGNEVSC